MLRICTTSEAGIVAFVLLSHTIIDCTELKQNNIDVNNYCRPAQVTDQFELHCEHSTVV